MCLNVTRQFHADPDGLTCPNRIKKQSESHYSWLDKPYQSCAHKMLAVLHRFPLFDTGYVENNKMCRDRYNISFFHHLCHSAKYICIKR